MKHQRLIFTNLVASALDNIVTGLNPNGIFILVDENTEKSVLPKIKTESSSIADVPVIKIKAGDTNKNIEALAHVWKQLGDLGATRSSLLVNIGGGMVTDLGAFAASTFKRGIKFINIPTTLLAAVDASVGGKTGINFNGLKNEVGTFCEADWVI
ncbi:MAG: iron-containing alcohol dehydrogenase, partial [Muribaculaceae bacterium]|nr:iron-containing alcohol dehydrogenase [Muribaculaceae bacterium]